MRWWAAALAALACLACVASGEGDDTFEIQHAFGSSDWSKRGHLTFTIDTVKKKIKLKFGSSTHEFAPEEVSAFKRVMSENGFYRVRIQTLAGEWMMASIPACMLAGNRFREAFRFHTDKTGALLGFDYIPLAQISNCDSSSISSIKLLSKASASLPKDAHAVPLHAAAATEQTLMKTAGKGDVSADPSDEDNTEEKEAEPGFIRKYWYVFIPLALMSVLAPPPEEGEQQQQQQGGAAAGGGRAAASGGAGRKKRN